VSAELDSLITASEFPHSEVREEDLLVESYFTSIEDSQSSRVNKEQLKFDTFLKDKSETLIFNY